MSTSSSEDLEELQLLAEAIARKEITTKHRVISLTTLGLIIIFVGMILFAGFASKQALLANEQAMKVRREEEEAARQRDRAVALLTQIQRSVPVLDVSPNGKRSISQAGWLLSDDGTPIEALVSGSVDAAVFSPDGRLAFVVNASNGESSIFESETGKLVTVFTGVGHVISAVFSPDAMTLVITSDKGVFRCQTADGQIQRLNVGTERPIIFAAFGPSSRTLVLGTLDGGLMVSRDAGLTFVLINTRTVPSGTVIHAAAFSKDERKILTLYTDGRGIVVDLLNGHTESTFYGLVRNLLK